MKYILWVYTYNWCLQFNTQLQSFHLIFSILHQYRFSFMLKIFSNRRSHHDEKTTYSQLERSSPQIEKALVQQRRPSTAKHQRKNGRKRTAQSCEQKESVDRQWRKACFLSPLCVGCGRVALGAKQAKCWSSLQWILVPGPVLCTGSTQKRKPRLLLHEIHRPVWVSKQTNTNQRQCAGADGVLMQHTSSLKSHGMKIVAPVYGAFAVDWALSYVNQINSRQQPLREGEERGLGC